MKYGDKYERKLVDRIHGTTYTETATYRYAEWNGFRTDDNGCGLWIGYNQILGTCQFSVAGCATEKAAKAKIRRWVKGSIYDGDAYDRSYSITAEEIAADYERLNLVEDEIDREEERRQRWEQELKAAHDTGAAAAYAEANHLPALTGVDDERVAWANAYRVKRLAYVDDLGAKTEHKAAYAAFRAWLIGRTKAIYWLNSCTYDDSDFFSAAMAEYKAQKAGKEET